MKMMMTPAHKGTELELLAAATLMARGAIVSIPAGHGQPYDLIADVDGHLSRIQVRKAWHYPQRDRWDVGVQDVVTVWRDGRRRQVKTPGIASGYDFLVVRAADQWYVIPGPLLAGRSSLSFRPPGSTPAKKLGKPPALDVEFYRDAWALLQGGQNH